MKIVINHCWGGFGLSRDAVLELAKRQGIVLYPFKFGGRGNPLPLGEGEDPGYIDMFCTTPEYSDETYYSTHDISREDANLLALLEEWGSEKVSGQHSKLAVVEIPDGVAYEIAEYDGMEHVAEQHRTWYAG